MIINIIAAETEAHIKHIKELFLEYESFLGIGLDFQNFNEELEKLPGKYTPPEGALFIAYSGKIPAGCAAFRKIGEGVCEMKRLYLRQEYRGSGLGRELAMKIIDAAKNNNYKIMRLDTLSNLKEAISLYFSLGFRTTEPYYANPLENVIYMEINL